jgi:hypothetical protein
MPPTLAAAEYTWSGLLTAMEFSDAPPAVILHAYCYEVSY